MTPDELGDSAVLVDTNVFSYVVWRRGPHDFYEPFLTDRLWVLSFVTVAELRYGALHAGWGTKRQAELERRIHLCVVLPFSDALGRKWAELSVRFKDQISENDLWIAAGALSQDPILPIASHDKAFSTIGTEFGITVVRQNAD